MAELSQESKSEHRVESEPRVIGVGMPALLYLEQFGSVVWDAFGHPPYLVGSALVGKEWRDVDVRLMLDDDEYLALFGEITPIERTCGKWAALCMAFSALGRQMTGLPIDFQIQVRTKANGLYGGMPRQALGYVGLRIRKNDFNTELAASSGEVSTRNSE